MNVITAYPIYVNGNRLPNNNGWISANGENYSNAPDVAPPIAGGTLPTAEVAAEAAKKGLTWDKAQGWIKKGVEVGKQTGILDWVGNQLGLKGKGKGKSADQNVPVSTMPVAPEKKGMSTTTILMIGGGVVAVAAIIYFATRKK